MHDYEAKSLKLFMVDPHDPLKQIQVLVSIAHVVRLVPRYYVVNGGKRTITEAEPDDARLQERGLRRSFVVYDDIGGYFDSYLASDAAQAILEQMWGEAA